LDTYLAAYPNATETEIEGALDLVCNLLPTSYKTQCENFVANEVPALLKYITTYTPQQLCAAVGLCSSSSVTEKKAVVVIQALEDSTKKCQICEMIFTFAQTYFALHQNETEAQLQAIVDKFCEKLPAPYNTTCEFMVNAELPQLFAKLLSETPEQLCQAIKVCNSSLTLLSAQKNVDAQFVASAITAALEVGVKLEIAGAAPNRVSFEKQGVIKVA